LVSFSSSERKIVDASLSSDEKWLAVGLFRTIKIFELATGKELAELIGHSGQLNTVCFAPDRSALASGDNFDARLWTGPPTIEGVRIFNNGHAVDRFSLSKDGTLFATEGPGSTVKVWDSGTGKVTWQAKTQDDSNFSGIYSLVLSGDGKLLATGAYEKGDFREKHQVKIWDAQTGRLLHTLDGHKYPIRRLAFSPDRKLLASADDDSQLIQIWDIVSGKSLNTLKGLSGWPSGLAFSRDGKRLASNSIKRVREELVNSVCLIWDVTSGEQVVKIEKTDRCFAMPHFSADGKLLYCSEVLEKAIRSDSISIIDIATGKPQKSVALPNQARIFAISDDEKWLAFCVGNEVQIWDLPSRKPLAVLRGHNDSPAALAFTGDGRRLFSAGSSDHTVREWDLRRIQDSKR
jgi:WD40 repeat protein